MDATSMDDEGQTDHTLASFRPSMQGDMLNFAYKQQTLVRQGIGDIYVEDEPLVKYFTHNIIGAEPGSMLSVSTSTYPAFKRPDGYMVSDFTSHALNQRIVCQYARRDCWADSVLPVHDNPMSRYLAAGLGYTHPMITYHGISPASIHPVTMRRNLFMVDIATGMEK